MKSMKFVHLTDTHMNAPSSEGPFAKFKLAEKVKQTFLHLRDANVAPHFVLITGDLSHEGDAADYAYIRTVLDECAALIGAPVHVVLGNHDHRSAFRQGYLGEAPSEEAYYYSLDFNGLRLIGLNSQVAGRHDGELDAAQLAWLKDELATPAPLGTIVGIHHPMMSVRGMPGDHLLANRAQLGDVIEGTDVIGVMAGHVHSNNVGTYRGILNVAAAGTAFTGELADAENYKMVDFCGFNIVDVTEEGISIQTTVLPTSGEEYFRFPISMLVAQH